MKTFLSILLLSVSVCWAADPKIGTNTVWPKTTAIFSQGTIPAADSIGRAASSALAISSDTNATLTGNLLANGATLTNALGVTSGGSGTATAFTPGSVVFAGSSGVYAQDNSNLFFDDSNNVLVSGASTSLGNSFTYGNLFIGTNNTIGARFATNALNVELKNGDGSLYKRFDALAFGIQGSSTLSGAGLILRGSGWSVTGGTNSKMQWTSNVDGNSGTVDIIAGRAAAGVMYLADSSGGLGTGALNLSNLTVNGNVTTAKVSSTTPYALTYASPTSVDVTLGNVFTVTTVNATGSVTFNATAGGTAGQRVVLIITNDGTSAKTITFGTNFVPNGTLTPSGVGKVATIEFISNGTSLYELSRTVLP